MSRRFQKMIKEKDEKLVENVIKRNIESLEKIKLDKNYNIGVIIPTSSNKKNYTKISDYIFINILLPSFINTCSLENNYNFYLGYDDDDIFLKENKEKIVKFCEDKYMDKIKIYFIEMKNMKGKVGKIWSLLGEEAIKHGDEYLLQVGDDIEFLTKNWDKIMIEQMLLNDNHGVLGPYDYGIKNSLLTQSFVHGKTHYSIFGNYFPEEIINHNIDSWITHVYGGLGDNNFNIINKLTNNDVRYIPVSDKETYLSIKKKDLTILLNYLRTKSKVNVIDLRVTKKDIEKKILTVGILINSDEDTLTRLINKILVSGIKYDFFNIVIGDNIEDIIVNSDSKYLTFIKSSDLVSNNYFYELQKYISVDIDFIGFIETIYKLEFTKSYKIIKEINYSDNLYPHNCIIKRDKIEKIIANNIFSSKIMTCFTINKFLYHTYV